MIRRAAPVLAIALAAAAGFAPGRAPASAEEDRPLLVRAGTVIPVEGEPIRDGAVLCRDGKIAAVGKSSAVPAGDARVIDLGPAAVLLPGLVAASSGLAAPGAGVPESVAPGVRALDGFDFHRPAKRALEGGVTTVYLDAGRRRVIGGQGAVVKLAGASAEARTLRARAGLFGALGDPARNPPGLFEAPESPDPVAHPLLPLRPQGPGSRMGAVAMLREAIAAGKAGAGDGTDPAKAALAAVAAGQEPLRLRADAAADLEAALALAAETGIRLVLGGGRDAHGFADRLAAAGIPAVLESPHVPGRVDDPFDPDEAARRAAAMGGPAALEKAGALFAIAAEDPALPDLLLVAAAHVRSGLSPERAIRAVTLDAARILGVHERVGALVPGRDADLAAFSGDPLDVRSTAILTVVDGAVVHRREPGSGVLVIRAGAVHTGTGEVFAPGAVVVEGGRIVEVGPSVGLPPGARIVDRPDGVIVPGFVDAHSRLGLRAGTGSPAGNLTAAASVAEAFAPEDPAFAAALGAGITTTLVSPGGPGPVVGTTAVVKTAGGDRAARTVKGMAGVEVSLAGSGDLPGALQALRDTLTQAKQHHEAWEKYEKEIRDHEKAKKEWEEAKKKRDEAAAKAAAEAKPPADPKPPAETKPDEKKPEEKKPDEKPPLVEPKEPAKPGANPSLDPWREVFRKRAPVLCRAATGPEVAGALKVVVEEAKLPLVIVGGDDAWKVADALKKAGVGVLLGPRLVTEEDGKVRNAARSLAAAGVPFGLASDAGAGSRDLPLLAAWAVRHGLGPAAAIRALTLGGARLLGVDHRVGSLEAGKDADLVLFTGDPFGAGSRVRAVWIAGKVVHGAE